jgi:hypothetical protein
MKLLGWEKYGQPEYREKTLRLGEIWATRIEKKEISG